MSTYTARGKFIVKRSLKGFVPNMVFRDQHEICTMRLLAEEFS